MLYLTYVKKGAKLQHVVWIRHNAHRQISVWQTYPSVKHICAQFHQANISSSSYVGHMSCFLNATCRMLSCVCWHSNACIVCLVRTTNPTCSSACLHTACRSQALRLKNNKKMERLTMCKIMLNWLPSLSLSLQ